MVEGERDADSASLHDREARRVDRRELVQAPVSTKTA
jgi:hypothetical protein